MKTIVSTYLCRRATEKTTWIGLGAVAGAAIPVLQQVGLPVPEWFVYLSIVCGAIAVFCPEPRARDDPSPEQAEERSA